MPKMQYQLRFTSFPMEKAGHDIVVMADRMQNQKRQPLWFCSAVAIFFLFTRNSILNSKYSFNVQILLYHSYSLMGLELFMSLSSNLYRLHPSQSCKVNVPIDFASTDLSTGVAASERRDRCPLSTVRPTLQGDSKFWISHNRSEYHN